MNIKRFQKRVKLLAAKLGVTEYALIVSNTDENRQLVPDGNPELVQYLGICVKLEQTLRAERDKAKKGDGLLVPSQDQIKKLGRPN